MMHISQEQEVVDKLVAWGTAHPSIRAMILTSSRARPDGPVDALSDYDLILAVSDVESFAFDNACERTNVTSAWHISFACMIWPLTSDH